MWFTRQDQGVRVWFQAVRSTGQLRAGLVSGDFTAMVIDPDDSASVTIPVSESVQRPGNYFFDVPSAFLLLNGLGDYNVSIEIDSINGPSGTPNVRAAMADALRVFREDFDSLSGSIWNATASQFNASGSMGFLVNMIDDIQSGTVNIPAVVSGVWNANAATFNTSGTMGHLENMLDEISSSVVFTQGIENGTWIISGSLMIMYSSGTNDELARFQLQDINGLAIDPATQNPFRRIRT